MITTNRSTFDNCVDCDQYAPVDLDSRCPICATREVELLETAHEILREHPHSSRDDIADRLQTSVSRVDGWIRSGKIRCRAIKSRCPKCGTELHSFSCKVCKYKTTEEILQHKVIETRRDKQSYQMHSASNAKDRFSRDRKRSSGSRFNHG